MANFLTIFIRVFIFLAVNANTHSTSNNCKFRHYERKLVCRGDIEEHLEMGFFSKQLKHAEHIKAVMIYVTDLGHTEGNWFHGLNITNLTVHFNNHLSVLNNDTFNHLQNLEVLDLSYNSISVLSIMLFLHLNSLTELKLDHNMLKKLEPGLFASQCKLKVLNLSGNKLKSLRNDIFSSMVNLEELHVNSNMLESLDSRSFVSLERLVFLNMSDNRLSDLPESLFTYQKYLKELHFDKNNITKVDSQIFLPISRMEVLSFGSNRIEVISGAMFAPLVRLKRLEVTGCPINCNCPLKDFYQWCEERSIKTNLSCRSFNNGSTVSVAVLQQIDCSVFNKFTSKLIAVVCIMIFGMLVTILLNVLRKRSRKEKWRSTESVNEYEYVEYPHALKEKLSGGEHNEQSQRYTSVRNVAMSVYGYLRPIPGRVFKIRPHDEQDEDIDPVVPEDPAPRRPVSLEYDVAYDFRTKLKLENPMQTNPIQVST